MRTGRFLLLLTALVTCAALYGQEKATIVGTVTDPTGSVVPNVKVIIINTATQISRTVETNSAGNYVAPELRIGPYSVRAEQQAFNSKDSVLF